MSVPAPREPRQGGRWETIRYALDSNARTLFRRSRRLSEDSQKSGDSGSQKSEDPAVSCRCDGDSYSSPPVWQQWS